MPNPNPKPNAINENLAQDGSFKPIQIGGYFQTVDGAESPLSSPLTLTGSPQFITVPQNCAEFILAPSADMKISEVDTFAHYYTIPAGQAESLECTRMAGFWVEGSGTLSFRCNMI